MLGPRIRSSRKLEDSNLCKRLKSLNHIPLPSSVACWAGATRRFKSLLLRSRTSLRTRPSISIFRSISSGDASQRGFKIGLFKINDGRRLSIRFFNQMLILDAAVRAVTGKHGTAVLVSILQLHHFFSATDPEVRPLREQRSKSGVSLVK